MSDALRRSNGMVPPSHIAECNLVSHLFPLDLDHHINMTGRTKSIEMA
jgi:hypothetical protein